MERRIGDVKTNALNGDGWPMHAVVFATFGVRSIGAKIVWLSVR